MVLTGLVTDSQPAHLTSTGERLDPATADAKENARPNGTAVEIPKIATNHAIADTTIPPLQHSPKPRFDDADKIPVISEEPPPIKAVRVAPGMSATSGPLEDFPEGEFQ